MAFTPFPSATFAAAPGVNDDTTKGYDSNAELVVRFYC